MGFSVMNEPKKQLSRAGKRQLVLLAAIALLIVAVLMLVMKVAENNAPPPRTPKAKTQTTNITAPGAVSDETAAQVTDRRLAEFQAMLRAQEQEQAKRLQEAAEKAREEERQRQERENNRSSRSNRSIDSEDSPEGGGNLKLFDPSKMGQNSRRESEAGSFAPGQLNSQPQGPRVRTLTFSETAPMNTGLQNRSIDDRSDMQTRPISIGGNASDYEAVGRALRGEGARGRLGQSPQESVKAETYLPSGTFFRVSTVNGIDAPAGGQAQNNPQPLLMVVSDWGNMPNSFKADVKHCFVIGSAWGDLSAERAMARTESLSCIRPNGDVIDVPLTGFVVGPDGRNGFRGRVVTKQGQVLANALWTGMLSGFGDVARQMNSTPVIIAGSVANRESPTGQEVLQRSALGGLGEAAKTLSQYYITLAEKLYPVIETDGGLTAEIVLTRGVAIKKGEKVGTTNDFSNLGQALNRLRQ